MAKSYVIEVPRPLYETHSFEFGLSLFQRHEAAALLLAGAHSQANSDDSSDVARLANRANVFNLVHEVLLRQWGLRPMVIVQSRAISAPVDADVVIATDDGGSDFTQLSILKRDIASQLELDGMRIRYVDGSEHISGYELGNQLQTATLSLALNKELISLWLSPSLRTKYRQSMDNRLLLAQFETVGIPTVEADLYSYLSGRDDKPSFASLPDELRNSVEQYLRNYDIVSLRQITRQWHLSHLTRVIDHDSGQSFLLIAARLGAVPHVVNLTGWLGDAQRVVLIDGLTPELVQEFVESKSRWLEVRGAP